VPKRQPKPEPITPDEVMGSPALQGFDTFLRYRSVDQPEVGNGAAEAPAIEEAPDRSAVNRPGAIPTGGIPGGDVSDGDTPMGVLSGGETLSLDKPLGIAPIGADFTIAEFRPGPKVRRALKAQDGHSIGEHAIYQALWNAASVETADTRLIRIGYGGLQSLCGLDKTNCKDNIQSLIRKLAVEVVSPFSVQRNQGNVYRVFSASAIMKRRRAAGMEWVIRNKGVRFVDQPLEAE